FISLLDEPNVAAKKIKSAVTDSDGVIKFDRDNKPGVSNLLSIYSGLTNETIKDIEAKYVGEGYGKFKGDLAEIVKSFLIDFQEKYESYYNS
ncbi:tryptophan--tRNA ligase, partial [Staphylococcus epidermidis]